VRPFAPPSQVAETQPGVCYQSKFSIHFSNRSKEVTMSESECQYLAGCPFFNDKMEINSGIGAMYKLNYCKKNFTNCARYMVVQVLGKGTAPADLFPNQQARVEQIIAQAKSS
jgi:hypothetical protein